MCGTMSFRIAAVLLCLSVTGATGAPPKAEPVDTFNYVLGTQTIGIKYQFTEKTGLVETAERIREMGSNLLKISMGRRYSGKTYSLPRRSDVKSLVDLARNEPSFRAVLDMPFATYHIWANCFASNRWADGLSERERKREYDELYALAAYLLDRYKGTGKTFLLGHWEGDWLLHKGYDRKNDPSPQAIKGMIDWLNVRQRAVDDAKRDAKGSDVRLYHYTEVNLVQKGMKGGTCLVNDVLPHTSVDYVSYSSYDTTNPHAGNAGKALRAALDYIESKLPPKAGIRGKRVFIGEYGFPLEKSRTPQKQDRCARDVCRAALEWGCPFVLYWQMYCNENDTGTHRGFWLIDNKNRKQPFYQTLSGYYARTKRFVAEFKKQHGRPLTDAEFRRKAVEFLKEDSGPPPAQRSLRT
jgi:hypothetical protein